MKIHILQYANIENFGLKRGEHDSQFFFFFFFGGVITTLPCPQIK